MSEFEQKRVFVANIPFSTTKQDLQRHMERAGQIIHVELFCDEKGNSRGCAVVEYSCYLEANQAVAVLNQSRLHSRTLLVKEEDKSYIPKPRINIPRTHRVSIENIPPSVTWQQLKEVFRICGSVYRAEVVLDRNWHSTGLGVVQFDHVEDANAAVLMFNGSSFNGNKIEVKLEKEPSS